MGDDSPSTPQRGVIFAVIATIVMHATLLVISATRDSVVFDESAHLAAGCAYLRYDEFAIYNQNPPLLRMIAALPVMLAHPVIPHADRYRKEQPQVRCWLYAEAFEMQNRERYQRLFFIGRLAIIPVSCLGAWLVFAWARSLYGAAAGLAACTIWALEPTVIANGSVVATDVGIAVAIFAALWTWQRFCTQPNAKRALLAALCVAIAHCCKFSAIMLWPIMLAMLLLAWLRVDRLRLRDPFLGYVLVAIITYAGVNLGYGYQHTFEPFWKLDIQSRSMLHVQHAFANLPAPLPRHMILGIDCLKWEAENGLPGYLLGESYNGSRWYYYPIALAVKLPISVILLLLLSFMSLIVRRPKLDETMLLVSLVPMAAMMIFGTRIDLGVRYLLPLYPLAFVLIARLWTFGRAMRIVASILLVGLAIESLSICPRYFTFFNVAAGGPSRGWKIVNDANVDWGQGLIDLKNWQDATHSGPIELAYFGAVNPATYGIDWVPFGKGHDEKYVAVSSCFLVGMRHRAHGTTGTHWLQLPYYQALQREPVVANPAGAIFIYRREDFERARSQ
jgi:hypothetical protein